jgi:hypothetical protein
MESHFGFRQGDEKLLHHESVSEWYWPLGEEPLWVSWRHCLENTTILNVRILVRYIHLFTLIYLYLFIYLQLIQRRFFSKQVYTASNEKSVKWMMNWKEFGRKRLCITLSYYSDCRLEGLRKTPNLSNCSRSQGRDLHPWLPEYETGVFNTRSRYSIGR